MSPQQPADRQGFTEGLAANSTSRDRSTSGNGKSYAEYKLRIAFPVESAMYKAITLALALSAPAAAITPRGAAAATAPNARTALKLRGGTFGFDAHQTGEQCGIEEPEKEVVKTIKASVLFPLKVLGIRGGSDEADEEDEDDVDVDEEEAAGFR